MPEEQFNEEENEQFSILDPVKQQGLLKGGLNLATSLLPGVGAGMASPTDSFSLGNVFGGLGSVATEAAYYLPVVGSLLGMDDSKRLMDQGSDWSTRALGAVGFYAPFLDLPTTAAMGTVGVMASRRATQAMRQLDGTPLMVGHNRQNVLTELTGVIDTQTKRASFFPTMTDRRKKIMNNIVGMGTEGGLSPDDAMAGIAKAVAGKEAEDMGPVVEFLSGLADVYVSEAERMGNMPDVGVDPDTFRVALLAHELAKLDTALTTKNLLNLQGEFKGFDKLFEKALTGKSLTEIQKAKLIQGLQEFSTLTQDFSHPELVLLNDPRFSVHEISLRDATEKRDGSSITLKILPFETVAKGSISNAEASVRAQMMWKNNEAAMVHLTAQNIIDFYETKVAGREDVAHSAMTINPVTGERSMDHGRDWYKNAREQFKEFAEMHGIPLDEMIAINALASATEQWETNIRNGVGLALWVKTNRARFLTGDPKELSAEIMSEGMMSPLQGSTDRPLKISAEQVASLQKLYKHIEDGGSFDSYFAGKMGDFRSQTRLKVASFYEAIGKSNPNDIARRNAILYGLMTGQIDFEDVSVNGSSSVRNAFAMEYPLVMDRHAFAIGHGFSFEPDSSLTNRAPYEGLKTAYAIAAEALGVQEDLGRALDGNELQALTWIIWREERGTSTNFIGNSQFPATEQSGRGPTYIHRNREGKSPILDLIEGDIPAFGRHARRPRHDNRVRLVPMERFGASAPLRERDRVEHTGSFANAEKDGVIMTRMSPDGVEFVTGEAHLAGINSDAWFYPAEGKTSEGWRIMRPRHPRPVRDVKKWAAELMTSYAEGLSGVRIYNANHKIAGLLTDLEGLHQNGIHIVISLPEKKKDRVPADVILRGLSEDLSNNNEIGVGIEHEYYIQVPHEGQATVYEAEGQIFWSLDDAREAGYPNPMVKVDPVPEIRRELILSFKTVEDMQEAWTQLHTPMAISSGLAHVGANSRDAALGAARYVHRFGKKYGLDTPKVIFHRKEDGTGYTPNLPEEIYEKVAKLYEKAKKGRGPLKSSKVRKSWEALRREVYEQYQFLTNELGIKVIIGGDDHIDYSSPAEMLKDINENGVLRIRPSRYDSPHPFFTDRENDMFRAVHDFFGHAGEGNNFTREGEWIALAKHAPMFSKLAQGALAWDLMGNTSWLVASWDNKHKFKNHLEEMFPHLKHFPFRIGGAGEVSMEGVVYAQEGFNDGSLFLGAGNSRITLKGKNADSPEGLDFELVPMEFFDNVIKGYYRTPEIEEAMLAGTASQYKQGRYNPVERRYVRELATSIETNGFIEPIPINYWYKSGKIVVGEGNHRFEAAVELGLTHIPVKFLRQGGDAPAHAVSLSNTEKLKWKDGFGNDPNWDGYRINGEYINPTFNPHMILNIEPSVVTVPYGATLGAIGKRVTSYIGPAFSLKGQARRAKDQPTNETFPLDRDSHLLLDEGGIPRAITIGTILEDVRTVNAGGSHPAQSRIRTAISGTVVQHTSGQGILYNIPTNFRRVIPVREGRMLMDVETGREFLGAKYAAMADATGSPVTSLNGMPMASYLAWGDVRLGDSLIEPPQSIRKGAPTAALLDRSLVEKIEKITNEPIDPNEKLQINRRTVLARKPEWWHYRLADDETNLEELIEAYPELEEELRNNAGPMTIDEDGELVAFDAWEMEPVDLLDLMTEERYIPIDLVNKDTELMLPHQLQGDNFDNVLQNLFDWYFYRNGAALNELVEMFEVETFGHHFDKKDYLRDVNTQSYPTDIGDAFDAVAEAMMSISRPEKNMTVWRGGETLGQGRLMSTSKDQSTAEFFGREWGFGRISSFELFPEDVIYDIEAILGRKWKHVSGIWHWDRQDQKWTVTIKDDDGKKFRRHDDPADAEFAGEKEVGVYGGLLAHRRTDEAPYTALIREANKVYEEHLAIVKSEAEAGRDQVLIMTIEESGEGIKFVPALEDRKPFWNYDNDTDFTITITEEIAKEYDIPDAYIGQKTHESSAMKLWHEMQQSGIAPPHETLYTPIPETFEPTYANRTLQGLEFQGDFAPEQSLGVLPDEYIPTNRNDVYQSGRAQGRLIDTLQEKVPDIRAIAPEGKGPGGTKEVFEHYATDNMGNMSVHNSTQGSAADPHTRVVHIGQGEGTLDEYVKGETPLYETQRPDASKAPARFGEAGSEMQGVRKPHWIVDNNYVAHGQLVINPMTAVKITNAAEAQHIFDYEIGKETVKQIAMYVPEQASKEVPMIDFNTDSIGVDPKREVVIYKQGPKGAPQAGRANIGTLIIEVNYPEGAKIPDELINTVINSLRASGVAFREYKVRAKG